jgi:hypothetical protein
MTCRICNDSGHDCGLCGTRCVLQGGGPCPACGSDSVSRIMCSPVPALGTVRRVPYREEEAKIARLRAAVLELRGDHAFVFSLYDSLRETLGARCMRCRQIVVAERNPWPRPLLFGRWRWKPIVLRGLPTIYYCRYSQAWAGTFDDPAYR